ADRARFAEVPGGVEQRDPAQDRRARPAREGLDDTLPTAGAERALRRGAFHRLGRNRSAPVEAADDLARAQPYRVPILTQGAEVDLSREVRDLRARHADAEIAARDAQAPEPLVVEDLGPPGEHRV